MKTEEEASKCWCPFALAVRGDGVAGFNRDLNMEPDVATFCIASACMAWRWGEGAHWEGDTSGRTPEETGAVTVRRGFCGLAGKP